MLKPQRRLGRSGRDLRETFKGAVMKAFSAMGSSLLPSRS
jgi:hypothetical protein